MVAPSQLSPNVGNYYIGKGIVSIKLLGEDDFVDCGNVPTFEFLPKVTKLDHFSSRSGTKVKDYSAVTEVGGTLTMIMEEMTARNVAFALMGHESDSGPSGDNISIDIFANPIIEGAIRFVGENDIGPRWTHTYNLVQFSPTKALALIGATWGTVDLSGDVLLDPLTGKFGTATVTLLESPSN